MHPRICQTVLCQLLSAETTLCIIVSVPGELILLDHPSALHMQIHAAGLDGKSTKRRNRRAINHFHLLNDQHREWTKEAGGGTTTKATAKVVAVDAKNGSFVTGGKFLWLLLHYFIPLQLHQRHPWQSGGKWPRANQLTG